MDIKFAIVTHGVKTGSMKVRIRFQVWDAGDGLNPLDEVRTLPGGIQFDKLWQV